MDKTEGIKTLEDTIMMCALAANKSISDAWPTVTEEAPIPWKSDFIIRTEMLWFFLHMMTRYAFEVSPKARATLQDELVPATIQRLIITSFDRSHVKKGVDVKALDAGMVDEALEQFNEAEMDYSSCKRLGVEGEGDFLREETVLGKLAARTGNLTGQGASVELRLLIWATAVESLGKSGLKEQVRKLIDEG